MTSSNSAAFLDLPPEIIAQIVDYLDENDLVECVCVSFLWYNWARPYRYRSVDLDTRSLYARFMKSMQHSRRNPKRRKILHPNVPRFENIGDTVRALKLKDGYGTTKSAQQLAALCPNVTTVVFEYTGFSRRKEQKETTRLFYSPVPFFQHFHPASLTKLALIERGPYHNPGYSAMAVLPYVPQLESLRITGQMVLTVAGMEEIHKRCPQLKELECRARIIPGDTTMTLPEIQAVTPTRIIQKLALPGEAVWGDRHVCNGPWFKYITRKYPCLKKLDISTTRHIKYKRLIPQRDQSGEAASIVLRDYFPQLQDLRLAGFAGNSSITWPQLVNGVPKVELLDDHNPTMLSDWIGSEATKGIQHLRLPTISSALNDIHHCKHLRTLVLEEEGRNIAYPELPINTLLSSCVALETLKVVERFICYDSQVAKQSNIKALVLKNSFFADYNVLARIGEQCPRLVHLDLYCCRWVDTNAHPTIRILMPRQWFTYFRLVMPRVCTFAVRRGGGYGSQRPPEWSAVINAGFNDSFAVKTPNYENWAFFWYSTRMASINLSRLRDRDLLHTGNEDLQYCHDLRREREQHLKAIKQLIYAGSSINHGAIISFRGTDRLYINNVRVDVDDTGFNRTIPKSMKMHMY